MESSITATSPRPVAAAFSEKTARFPAFLGRKTATISPKSFSLNSRRNARAAVTHPAAPAWVRPAIRIWWRSSTHPKTRNRRKVLQMTKHDDCFRRFERMAKSAKKNLSGDKPGSCSRCLYYRPDFKFRFCQFTRCPYELKENVFRRKPLTRDKFSGKGGA